MVPDEILSSFSFHETLVSSSSRDNTRNTSSSNNSISSTTTADPLIIPYESPSALAQAAADRFLLTLGDILAHSFQETHSHRLIHVALTGGRDGTAFLKALENHPLLNSIDWSSIVFWWGDERFVSRNSLDRNAFQAQEYFLQNLVEVGALPQENIHPMPWDSRSLSCTSDYSGSTESAGLEDNDIRETALAARAYEEELRKYCIPLGNNSQKAAPHFDIALFGVGEEGHIASLFPFNSILNIFNSTDSSHRADLPWAIGVTNSPKLPRLRVSLTPTFIQRTDRVWIIASGHHKRAALQRGLEIADNPEFPVSFARGKHQTLWMVDSKANPLHTESH